MLLNDMETVVLREQSTFPMLSRWFTLRYTELTLNRNGPTGGFAYGIPEKLFIALPPLDSINLPINLFPFVNVTLNSSD